MYTGNQYPQFFTAACLEWQWLLEQDRYKDKLIEDLRCLVESGWIKVYAFVIMPNHLHYLWHAHPNLDYNKVRDAHLWSTTQKIKKEMMQNNEEELLSKFYTGEINKAYNFWSPALSSIDLYTPKVIYQKMEMIHNNPMRGKWQLCEKLKDYQYSSAEFYETGFDRFGLLTNVGERGIWDREPDRMSLNYF
jgi:putative transposase